MINMNFLGILSAFLILVHEGVAFIPKWRSAGFAVPAKVGGTFDLRESSTTIPENHIGTDVVEETDSKSTLQFRADIQTSSSALPYPSREEVELFFNSPINRNLFITAGGKREYISLDVTTDLLEAWTRICVKEGLTIPNEKDEIFTVKTGGMGFPGLSIETRATMGIKLVETESGPTYEVTLIGDDRKVKGLAPVVYIFNKLTGGGEGSGSSDNVAVTKIMCEFNSDTSNVTFKTSTQFTIKVRFPSILMKIIPTTKEKAEEQGSQAITKAVGVDVEKSMVAFEEAYRKVFG